MFWTTFVFAEDIFYYLKVGYTRHWNSTIHSCNEFLYTALEGISTGSHKY